MVRKVFQIHNKQSRLVRIMVLNPSILKFKKIKNKNQDDVVSNQAVQHTRRDKVVASIYYTIYTHVIKRVG